MVERGISNMLQKLIHLSTARNKFSQYRTCYKHDVLGSYLPLVQQIATDLWSPSPNLADFKKVHSCSGGLRYLFSLLF